MLASLVLFVTTTLPNVFPGWFFADFFRGSTIATYEVDQSGWDSGTTPATANVGVSAGQGGGLSIASGGAMKYGEDADGMYLANDGDPGATPGTYFDIRSTANINNDANRDGECYHISYKMKWVLDGTGIDGVTDNLTTIWANFGSSMRLQNTFGWNGSNRTNDGQKFLYKTVNTQSIDARRAWGDRRDNGAIALRYGEVYQIDIWVARTNSNSHQIWVTINDRTVAINDGWVSNAISAGRIYWDDTLGSGVEQRLYDFSMEAFASGGMSNYRSTYDESALDPDVIVLHNAIQTPAAVSGRYGDAVWDTTVSEGTPDFRGLFRTAEEIDWAFSYDVPRTCALVMESRKAYRLPSYNGRSVVGQWFQIGDGSGRVDLCDESGYQIIGFGWDAGITSKALNFYTPGGSGGDLVQDTGIDLTPGRWYEITLHFADDKSAGIVVQDVSTSTNWALSTGQTNFFATASDFTGRPLVDVVPRITAGTHSSGTNAFRHQGLVLAAAWPAAVVSSFTMTDDPAAGVRQLARMPKEGVPLFGGGHLPGQRETTVPIGGSWREIGCFGRSGGAWVRRSNGEPEFRKYGWGDATWAQIHAVGHAFRWDIWDEFQNTLDAVNTLEEMQGLADLLTDEMAAFDTAAAANGVLVFDPDQPPPIDGNTGGGSTPSTSWNEDCSAVAIAIKAVTRAHRLSVNTGSLIVGNVFNGRTLTEAQLDFYGDSDIHPDNAELWHDEAWATAVFAPAGSPARGPRGSRRVDKLERP